MSRSFRYTFILVLFAAGTALSAVGGWRYARASAPVSGPIILISVDALRADRLPVYGYHNVRTPAIDALAADGVVFDRAYSHAPQTLPAHAALLTGRLPFENGVRDDIGFAVKPGVRLLPQMLRDRAFSTGGVVSAFVLRKETGIGQGFDFFDDGEGPRSPEGGVGPLERDGTVSEAIAERWLASQHSSRVFLFLHLDEPHEPYAPPERFAEFTPYDGEIAYADEIIGRLVRYLKGHQLYDQSTIILLSDHGEGLGDHGEQGHGLFLYDEAIHVPLIIKQAGNAKAGRHVPDLVQHIDIAPTVLDLVKAPIPSNLRGRSLKPLLDGTGHLPERSVYSEALYGRYHFGWSELTALTDGRFRYIRAPKEELYDLERDPQERDNLADSRTTRSFASALDRLEAGAVIQPPSEISADARERLQLLGYGVEADVTAASADALPDPKDKVHLLESYRKALDLAEQRRWAQASTVLRQILDEDPELVGIWDQLATLSFNAERFDQAVDAYKHIIELKPADSMGYVGAATAWLTLKKLDDARAQAELAVAVAADNDTRGRVLAHELLATIAIERHDFDEARAQARLAREADPSLPVPTYFDARILYDQGKYADALPLFQQAIAESNGGGVLQIADLHFYAADTLARLHRASEAEQEFLEELKHFPQNTRARAGLATLYQESGQSADAAQTLDEMVRVAPTPDTYALAARLSSSWGNKEQADALRAQARRAFPTSRPTQRAARH